MTRSAAVAGQFYPEDSRDLLRTVNGLLSQSGKNAFIGRIPKAMIVPHAGYRYSGPVAASAYKLLTDKSATRIRRVVLMGPAHRARVEGIAASGADGFATPLGKVPVDTATVDALVGRFPWVGIDDGAHRDEHSLETQLPFLQQCLRDISLVPLVIGRVTVEEVVDCLEFLWGSDETLVLVSSDLSHYHPYAVASRLDETTSSAIRRLDPSPITLEHACGRAGVCGLLRMAQKHKLGARALDVRNSGDTSGRRDQVVGYGSYAFFEPVPRFAEYQRLAINRIAWQSIDHHLANDVDWFPDLTDYSPPLTEPGTCFVTLHDEYGDLRGCVGTVRSEMPLIANVAQNARKAAFGDTRFGPLSARERESVQLEVSVLGPRERVNGSSEREILNNLNPYVDGLVLQSANRRGTFLPAVWHSLPDPGDFMRQLKRKAGLPEDGWGPDFELYRFDTETW